MPKEKLLLILILAGIAGNVVFCLINGMFIPSLEGLYQLILIFTPLPLYFLFRKLMKFNGRSEITNIVPYALAACVMTIAITFGLVKQAQVNAPQILAILACLYLCLFGMGLMKETENSGRGLKTPWSLKNKKVLYKTNQYAGRVLNLAGVLGIFTAIYLGIIYTLILAAGCLASIWYYSYQTAKKES